LKKPELLAPGGSFLAAFHAFNAGADGVYLGLTSFSARAAAQNFTLEQLRRIRQLALDRSRKVYVTLNTIVREEEMRDLRETLSWLEALRVDGVIVQDLGVCDLVRREFPGIEVHASTQMGVHNDSGLRVAEDLGIRRAVLSRELPLERIRALRERHPRIELEVFIHGALCYSFSGACLASSALTGRSGNRGDCAQVCRSVFRADGPPGGSEPGHLFSTRDLFLGRGVLKLAEIGIDALKIEGRMKSPEYVFNVTRLYREVLDRGDGIPAAEYDELVRKSELGFSRTRTPGWFPSALGVRLLEPGAPGHRGAFIGRVEEVRDRWITFRLAGDLSLHDGLAFIPPGSAAQAAFPVLGILKEGRDARFARRGETVSVEVPLDAAAAMPARGEEIRQLSSRFLDLQQPSELSFPPYKIPREMRITLGVGRISFAVTGFPVFAVAVTVEPARSKKPFLSILSALLEESGDSAFRPGNLSFSNDSGFTDDGVFVRPSELKKIKNGLYAFLDAQFPPRGDSGADSPPAPAPGSELDSAELATFAHRGLITPPDMEPVPFVGGDPERLDLSRLAELAGFRWLPLPPVIMDDAPWIESLRRLARLHEGTKIAVGLNNISHLGFAQALSAEENLWFFGDFYLYAANERTLKFLGSRVPRFLFAYEWLEAEPSAAARAPRLRPVRTVTMAAEFSPPLFYSLACFTRHSTNKGRCVEGCPKEFSGELRQGNNRFRMVVRDCVTYLFLADRIHYDGDP
jgi:putative protease